MDWIALSFITAILSATSTLIEKKTLFKEHAMEFSATLAMLMAVLSLPLFFFISYAELSWTVLLIIFGNAILGAMGFLCVVKAVRHLDVSNSSPLLVFGPVVVTFLALVFLGEKITALQGLGIAIIAFGSYVLELDPDHDFFEPFRTFVKSKYIHLLFLGMLIYGFGSLLDRVVLFRYGVRPLTYVALFHIFSAIIFFTLISIFYDGIKGIKRGITQSGKYFLIIAVLTITYRLTQSAAIKIAYVGLVAAIKRTSTLFSTIIGGTIFHEKNLLRKSMACLIMLAGAILLVS